jgi:hypothetical protein
LEKNSSKPTVKGQDMDLFYEELQKLVATIYCTAD